MHVRIGDSVQEGDVLATLYGADSRRLEEAEIIMEAAIRISAESAAPPKLIQKIIQ